MKNKVTTAPRNRTSNQNREPRGKNRRVENAEEEVRQDLSAISSMRVTGVEISTSMVPRSHSRDIVQGGQLGADQRQRHRDHAGNDEIPAVQIFVEPHAGLHHRRARSAAIAPCLCDATSWTSLEKPATTVLRVAEPDIRGVVVRRVEDDLREEINEMRPWYFLPG